ncbi:MAG: TonB-dependent receptor, partial [Bryobacterales bacterium]|nr:TonB-dependent receptor [Bryobacterales bacterium]
MRTLLLAVCLLVCSGIGFAQGDRGTITGSVTDPAGALVASAMIQARNVENGATYDTVSTSAGAYALSQLPVGNYEIDVTVPGFKKYIRQGIAVQVAAVERIDVQLEVGSASESIKVTAEAPLLQSESGEVSHNVNAERLDDLPIEGVGASQSGSSGVRNPNAVTQMIPGTYYVPNSVVRVNGAPGNSESYRVEGLDASNSYVPATPAQTQPSVDAIQEITVQTSNFAPEYGQVGGGFFNVTMRSGTNQLHGSAYEYLVNEILNANTPFLNPPQPRPRQRRNDYGFTLGGPVDIPKIYNGHNRTFFFFNFEQFRETQLINNTYQTVPTAAYRIGDFSGAEAAAGNLKIGTDPLGRPILENEIYNPTTTRTVNVNGQTVTIRDPFPGNVIPMSMMDPVALKVQSLIPLPNVPGASVNNYLPSFDSTRVTTIPAVKIDQQISTQQHLSFYWSETKTTSPYSATYGAANGLPEPITTAIGTYITSHVERLNYDYTLTPTLLLHLAAGYQQDYFDTDAKTLNYNAAQQLGLVGATIPRNFPQFTGLTQLAGTIVTNPGGGMVNMGPVGQNHNYYQKPEAASSLTWVVGSHTYKFGGEVRVEGFPGSIFTNANGSYGFSPNETGPAYNNGQALAGVVPGFAYASFLLGLVDSVNISYPITLRLGKKEFGAFAQDSWKITRNLTLDYGVRYDFDTYLREEHGRYPNFSPTTPNPNAGGLPGAVIFEGDGPGHCDCSFAKDYPFAFGPRLGIAYQISPKTVFRGGWGIVYAGTEDANGATQTVNVSQPVSSPGLGQPVMTLAGGIPAQYAPLPWPSLNAGQFVRPGVISQPPMFVDQNAGRPARQMQWSIGIQREIAPNLLAEAA